ncbi:hypothetical protein [Kitasatospora sp. NPDC018619]|uniref:hypothetical protein n=1 Tax=unclassified Kitasatospora TaxID=2633591 RepID=UPI0037ADD62E
MPSRIPGRRRAGLAGFAGLVLTVGLALTGCDPSAADGGATATAPASPTTAVTTAAATTPPVTPAAPAPVDTPSAQPTPAAPPATTPPAAPPAQPTAPAQPPAARTPQPKVTTAQPPTDPEPPAAAAGAGCDIRSAAGNCYEAGQFCRTADLGRSTHDAAGRVITCRMVSGKPHWQA